MAPALLDTDTLSEVIKGRNPHVRERARPYLATYGHFTFSIITRYEILRGLKATLATRQLAAFEERCRRSQVLPLTDEIIVQAADIYADLRRQGRLISDADILVAATALVHHLTLITENVAHFSRITGLTTESWRIG
ncbi:MAG: type II toxin-antitoxin system VapC family toxin [Candidatus Entotheonellia bacterium]